MTWHGKDDIIRRIAETPAGKELITILSMDTTKEEIAARVMLMMEDQYNWGVSCTSCAILLDDNYAKHVEIEQLREQLDIVTQEARESNAVIDDYEELYYNPNGF
jgi:hypothetical protein